MSEKPLFETSRDRNDFFIALLVIGFFIWLFGFSGLLGRTKLNLDAPAIVETTKDSDGDKVPDTSDKCPLVYGTSTSGCPVDTDGDGVVDHKDDCPRTKGYLSNNGCPTDTETAIVDQDSDNDGVLDKNDRCPNIKGSSADGCPPDRDSDGVADSEDRCPNVPGSAANQGCPNLQLAAIDREILTTAIRDVQFETGKATLKNSSFVVLNKIVDLMNKYPKAKLQIDGHTDNAASQELNMQLSTRRAARCKMFLLNKGIDDKRIHIRGYGETRPAASNDTPEGRKKNRRVEFDLNY